jgi:hypothetical protein
MNVVWLLVAGVFSILQMDRTTDRIDDAGPPDTPFRPDTAFGFGELFCAVMEIVASIYYVWKVDRGAYAWVASASNLTGWISVYAVGLYSASSGFEYDTRITQLIFHYAMIVFLWAINELALKNVKENKKDNENSTDRSGGDGDGNGNAPNKTQPIESSEVEDA